MENMNNTSIVNTTTTTTRFHGSLKGNLVSETRSVLLFVNDQGILVIAIRGCKASARLLIEKSDFTLKQGRRVKTLQIKDLKKVLVWAAENCGVARYGLLHSVEEAYTKVFRPEAWATKAASKAASKAEWEARSAAKAKAAAEKRAAKASGAAPEKPKAAVKVASKKPKAEKEAKPKAEKAPKATKAAPEKAKAEPVETSPQAGVKVDSFGGDASGGDHGLWRQVVKTLRWQSATEGVGLPLSRVASHENGVLTIEFLRAADADWVTENIKIQQAIRTEWKKATGKDEEFRFVGRK